MAEPPQFPIGPFSTPAFGGASSTPMFGGASGSVSAITQTGSTAPWLTMPQTIVSPPPTQAVAKVDKGGGSDSRAVRRRDSRFDHRGLGKVTTRRVLDLELDLLAKAPRLQAGLSAFAWASLTGLAASVTGMVHGICTVFSAAPPLPSFGTTAFAVAEIVMFIGFAVATGISLAQSKWRPRAEGENKTSAEWLAEIRARGDEDVDDDHSGRRHSFG